jgi:hypothetical protein
LSSTSRIHYPLQHAVGIGKSLENGVSPVLGELFNRVAAGRNADCARADGFTAANIRRRIANYDEPISRKLDAQRLVRAFLRDRRKFGTVLMI